MKESMPAPFKILKSEKEYNKALARLEELFDAPANSMKGQEAELLALLIEVYEEKHDKIESPDPIDAIRIRIAEMKLKQKDLVPAIGSEGIVSEVLNRKRKLSEQLKLTPMLLIKGYDLVN